MVYSAGHRENGEPSVAVTVCPSRLLAEVPWAEEFVEWWIWSIDFDANGRPIGVPKWPLPGGLRRQPRRLFEACKLLRCEWPYVSRGRVKAPERGSDGCAD